MNTIIIMGNLTRDAELTYTPSQVAVASFGIANNRKYKDKESTVFVDCVAFGKTAENICKFFSKGRPILISGLLDQESWTAKDGVKRSKHKIVVNGFDFVGDKQGGDRPSNTKLEHKAFDPEVDDNIPF